LPEPTKPRLAAAEKATGSRERAAGEHWNLGEGVGVRLCWRRKRWRWGLEGRPGAAEDRRRKSFEKGGAARRSRERRRPRAAVAGGSAGGGSGGEEGLEFDGGLLFFLVSGERRCFRVPFSADVLLHLRSRQLQ
jgi:hypothetical protein